jgi:hypothetical protein
LTTSRGSSEPQIHKGRECDGRREAQDRNARDQYVPWSRDIVGAVLFDPAFIHGVDPVDEENDLSPRGKRRIKAVSCPTQTRSCPTRVFSRAQI